MIRFLAQYTTSQLVALVIAFGGSCVAIGVMLANAI